ncbi:MAG: type II toxin-antitoxin system VapC family toxin [Candidatus Schekmanbacteria bacterium]|nr:type II toxin-antitoxin system VapC family toxin [Candidatus Schekmanbacteria bacterium]
MIFLDTHAVVWLYAGDLERFPAGAQRRLEEAEVLGVSPAVVLELQYLHEIGRVTVPPAAILADLGTRLGLRVVETLLGPLVEQACCLGWTRDPFDRLIVAQALLQGASLLTKDRLIREHLPAAMWD